MARTVFRESRIVEYDSERGPSFKANHRLCQLIASFPVLVRCFAGQQLFLPLLLLLPSSSPSPRIAPTSTLHIAVHLADIVSQPRAPVMDPPYISKRTSPVLSPSEVITPAKSKSRGLLGDLAGWPSYSDMRTQAPGSEDSGGLHQPGSLTRCADPSLPPCIAIWILISSGCYSETPFGKSHASGAFQKSSHLPTPHRYASH